MGAGRAVRKELKYAQRRPGKKRKDPEHRTPDGEASAICTENSAAADEFVGKNSGNRLLVTHAGVIRVGICHVLNIPLDRLFSFGIDYSGLSVIDNKKEPYRIILLNRTL
jgi:probable phosphoglycerate mutase